MVVGVREKSNLDDPLRYSLAPPVRVLLPSYYYPHTFYFLLEEIGYNLRSNRDNEARGNACGVWYKRGHMERDWLLSQGCPWFTKDRLMEQSDETRMWFCKICGLPALVTVIRGAEGRPPQVKRECPVCQNNKTALVRLPYATKLLMQELAGMNIIVRVLVTPYEGPEDIAQIFGGDKLIGTGTIIKE